MAPIRVEDREVVRSFLDASPVENAVVWGRVFQDPDYREVHVDGLPPRALLAMTRPETHGDATGFALHAVDPEAAGPLVQLLPSGPAFGHVTDLTLVDVLRARAEKIDARPAWLYRLDAKDFTDQRRHEVRPVDPKWAPTIAKLWDPEWPAEGYVRRRIEKGPSFGVYVDGELVGWSMTHLETDRVVMMGFLHVLEGHRGKGYARSLGSALVKWILDHGRIPACHIYTDNAASIELTESLGFRKVKQQVWGDFALR